MVISLTRNTDRAHVPPSAGILLMSSGSNLIAVTEMPSCTARSLMKMSSMQSSQCRKPSISHSPRSKSYCIVKTLLPKITMPLKTSVLCLQNLSTKISYWTLIYLSAMPFSSVICLHSKPFPIGSTWRPCITCTTSSAVL